MPFTMSIPIQFCLWVMLLICIIVVHSASAQCLSQHKELLLKFKSNLTYDSKLSSKLVTWDARTDCCSSWKGVNCDDSGHVIALDISSESISGPLDSSLGELKSLSVIHLDENSFSSPFPDFFTGFPNLTVLTASSCNFLGSVPQKLFQVSSLRTLDLWNNRDLLGSLPEFPRNGAPLENLDLSYTRFSGNLPFSIGNLVMLSSLNLFGCNFSGPIPGSISNLAQLVSLDFSLNHFTGSLPLLSMSSKLSSLGIRGNNLVGSIPSQWGNLKSLAFLDLSDNSFSGNLPAFLFTLPALNSLVLPNNKFSGQINSLENSSLSPLTELDLSGNNFQGPFPGFFFKFTSLTSLSLARNKFSGVLELAEFINFKNLIDLDLSHNNLSVGTNGDETVLYSLPKLNSLMLASCQIKKFPNLKNQTRLDMLDLSENQITGEIPNWLWDLHAGYLPFVNLSCNQFTHLQEPYHFHTHQYLDLHSNLLTTIPLPPRSAVHIDFSNNKFNSPIPADIGNYLTSAMSFRLAKNTIPGEIPVSICNANLLDLLDLSENSLSGPIPSCLVEKSSKTLEELNLHGNKLSGNIPDAFPEGCSLETLDLSYNLFQGKRPKSLANCKNLKVINLGHNRIKSTGRFLGM